MTATDFVKAIEAYYGKYERPMTREVVLRYCGHFHPEELRQIYQRLILIFSGQYKVAPDVAAIERARRELYESGGPDIYKNGRRIGHMDGCRFIPDLSLLSPEGLRKYTKEFFFYDNPHDYILLLEDDRKKNLLLEIPNAAEKKG